MNKHKGELMFQKLKDKTISAGISVAFDYKIKEFGEVLKFNLDSKNKTIELEVMLDGEREPLSVHIDNYELQEIDGKCYLVVQNLTTSRKWINVVASQYLNGQKIEVPQEYAKMLELVI